MTSRENLGEQLRALDVPEDHIGHLPNFPADVYGVLLYGSRARGDAEENSDVDLLAIAENSRPSIQSGGISVSFYTRDQLNNGIGSLYGAHLQRDGRILYDPTGQLAQAVAAFGPVDTDRLLNRCHALGTLFTTPEVDLPRYLNGLLRQARYLLRSAIYAQEIARGEPCFSVRHIAKRFQDPQLEALLSSRHWGPPTVLELNNCTRRLEAIVGTFPHNNHGSLEAAIVNLWGGDSDLLRMAFLALGVTGGSDYAEVDKILL